MKKAFYPLILILTVLKGYSQIYVPQSNPATGPMQSMGALPNFQTGGPATSIQEVWGLNLCGTNTQPVRVINSSLLVGYQGYSSDFGTNNALIAGRVGIGTTNPYTLLHVVAPVAKNATTVDHSNIASFLSTNDGSAPFGLRTMLYGGNATTDRYVTLQTTEAELVDGGNIFLQPAAGNVGIGTTNTYGYKLSVNGTIRSKEVKVEAGPWPDYVFKPTYNLPALSELKKFIEKNYHLPDMPSEAEVVKDGISLGEMNMQLLKKVEELTLYLIEQQKINKSLQNQINKLANKR